MACPALGLCPGRRFRTASPLLLLLRSASTALRFQLPFSTQQSADMFIPISVLATFCNAEEGILTLAAWSPWMRDRESYRGSLNKREARPGVFSRVHLPQQGAVERPWVAVNEPGNVLSFSEPSPATAVCGTAA